MEIEFILDTICPWCYLGKRRYEAAVSILEQDGVDIKTVFRPYFLAPHHPQDKHVDKTKSYLKKFQGNEEKLKLYYVEMMQAGLKENPPIHFAFGGTISNTLDSHILLDWVLETYGAHTQARVLECLMQSYFEEEKSIADVHTFTDVLARCAVESTTANVRQVMCNTTRRSKVKSKAAALVDDHMIMGVPALVVNKRFVVNGAQDTAVFLKTLRRLYAKIDSNTIATTPKL
eukprot:m.120431 g.120431  ORF g.120431 m.120431 type:complete len:231 (-) comp28803_c0_seq1:45-737(-)